ncbi:TPA: filamentous hemagglutinin N-terminal domain-containing protein [Stenotrophomonas maltophilia]
MNRIYRLVFNPSLGQVQVAAEFARGPRRCAPQRTCRTLWLAPLTAALLLTGSLPAMAQVVLPQNGSIIAGSGAINTNGNVMTVTQASQSALIQWSSFSIGTGDVVQFNMQQGSQSTAINLVTGSSASIISGQLLSSGQVFLINPAGITFTGTASVNVGGLLASTLMPGTPGLPMDGGPLPAAFQLAGGGSTGVVSNLGGTLRAAAGGISLIGGAVSNSGSIYAANGNIDLVAAGAATVVSGVSPDGMSRLAFAATAPSTVAGTGVSNVGVLDARSISMTALMGPGLSSTGINAGGTITANAIDAGDGSLTIHSTAPVVTSNAAITADTVAVVGNAVGGPVAIQIDGGRLQAGSVALNGGANGDVMLNGDVKADSINVAANNVVQASGALEGALTLALQGGATLGQSSNRIGSIGGSVGSDLTLATSIGLSNGDALSVGGFTALDAGTGNITLTHSGNSFGNRVSANGGGIALVSSGTLGLGNINARSLAAQGSTIDLSGTIITTGDQTYQSPVILRGNSTLQGSTVQFDGSVDGSYHLAVESSGLTTFSRAIGGNTALQSLSVTTGTGARLFGDVSATGMLAFDGPVQVFGSRNLSSVGGSLRFGGTLDGDGGSLNLSARQLTLGGAVGTRGAFDRIYGGADTLTLGSRIVANGEILLQGDVRLAGATQLVSTGGGTITTDGISSNVSGGYNLALSTSGRVQVNGNISAADVSITGQLFNGRGIISKGNLDIDSVASLVQLGSYQVDGRARFKSLGDINLVDGGNRFSGEVSLLGRKAELRAGNLQLGNTILSDNLRLNLGGSLQQTAGSALDIGGTTHIDASGSVLLNQVDSMGRPVNQFAGAVSLKGDTSYLYAKGTLAISGFDVASLWTIADVVQLPASGRSIGLQYFQGDAVLTGDSTLNSQLGQINFRGRIDGSHALTLTSGLDVVFAGDVGSRQALASLGINSAGPLQLGGSITTDGAIQLGNVNLAASTPRWLSIRSNNGNVVVGRVDGSGDGLSSLALNAHGTLELQSGAGTTAGAWLTDLELKGSSVTTKAIRTTGRLDVTSSSGFTQGGAFTVGGDASFSAGPAGNLVLDAYPNIFGGKVSLKGNQARIQALSGLALDGIDTTTLDAYSGGAMSLANANVAAAASLNATSLLFDGASMGGLLQATARTGDIRQGSGTLTFGSNSDLRASTDILLGNTGNRLGSALQVQGRDITLTSSTALDLQNLQAMRDVQLGGNGVRLGATSVLGALQVNSSGAITQSDALQVAGNSRFQAGSAITLDQSGNRFDGALDLAGGDIDVVAASLLLGSVSAGGRLALASAGGIRQQGGVQVAGTTRLNAGGAIDLQAGGNRFGGAVTVQGRQVALAADGTLQLQRVTADSLVARSGGRLALGTVDIVGNVVLDGQQLHLGTTHVGGNLQAEGRDGIDQSGALRVDGSADLRSDAGIALARSDNDLRGAVALTGVGIDLAAAGDLRVASLDNRNATVRLQAGGALQLPGTRIDTGSGDLQLLAVGALQLPAALRGNNITLHSGQDLQLAHDVLATGVLQLGSAGALTQSGGVLAAQRLQGSAGGNARLRGDNRIATLGDFSSQGLELQTQQGLQVTGTVQAGAQGLLDVRGGDLQIDGSLQAGRLRLQSAGAIRSSASGRLFADQLSGRAVGPTTLGNASLFVANAIGNLGDFQSPAGFSLTNTGNLTLATVNGSAFSVDAGSSAFYLKVQEGDIRQLGTTPVLAGSSRWWSSGGIGTQPAPIHLTSTSSTYEVDFVGRPPAYFHAVGADGRPLTMGGGPDPGPDPAAMGPGVRAQGAVLPRAVYVDAAAATIEPRAIGITHPGIRLPTGLARACDGDAAGCVQ